jgi:hypothetical protein
VDAGCHRLRRHRSPVPLPPIRNKTMNDKSLKTGAHLFLVGIAMFEFLSAERPTRKAGILGWAAFHAYLAYTDWTE